MAFGKLVMMLASSYALAATAGTYALADGETLTYTVEQNGASTARLTTFHTADFVSIGAATANEVCAVLNRDFAQNRIAAVATVNNGAIQITSNNDGPVTVTGGTAAGAFAFASATTTGDDAGSMPSAPVWIDTVALAGDGAYPAGGTPGFQALFRQAAKSTRTVLGVVAQDCGGYLVSYDPVHDKLKVWRGPGALSGVLGENSTANLSGVTFNLLVFSY